MSHIDYSLAGKALVVWLVVAALSSPMVGRFLERRKARHELKLLHDHEVERQRKLRLVADAFFQPVASELAERDRFARDAAVPMSDREWTDANSWLCDDDNQPKRIA